MKQEIDYNRFTIKEFGPSNKKSDKIYFGIHFKKHSVGVLPYVLENGIITKIGVVKEYNSNRNEKITSLLTGTFEKDDILNINTAIRELKEESGIDCKDLDKYIFLGNFYLSKNSDEFMPLYAVNITGLSIKEENLNLQDREDDLEFKIIDIKDALKINETILITAIFKLFEIIYKKI